MVRPTAFRAFVITLALALAAIAGIATTSPAEAATFTNNYNGQDSYIGAGSTTLKYANAHSPFNLSIWVVAGRASGKTTTRSDINAAYSITMYNASGQVVWSASGQRSRTYYLGSNVTRIVVTPTLPYVGAAVNWNKA